ncbi:HD-GYP domain-containing protein [Sphingomonas donggukensis]|uniref:HD-GYP domain-containing protein n=1 Tax=Sphingomonas donggukensis TaxID=2949093 RepID=A0ABY4TQL0_9SPHN|nr:HD-GYP domain-containing protein [Sphingomonas donggukensis]URW74681.1 HD-GYP domain-containing protein [Sphingomonas donggukensis]
MHISSDAEPGAIDADTAIFTAADWAGTRPRTRTIAALLPRLGRKPKQTKRILLEGKIAEARRTLAYAFEEIRFEPSLDVAALSAAADTLASAMSLDARMMLSLTRLRSRHEYTYVHSIGVSALMMAIARLLGYDAARVRTMGLAGLLHDIGKLHVPLEVLNKVDRLTAHEWSRIQSHSERGGQLLACIDGLDPVVIDVARHHHERVNGTGYPDKLAGTDISEEARIAAVCDVYDALTSSRSYKAAWTPAQALGWMHTSEGHFDRRILRALRTLIGAFPAGSLVRLQSGKLGVVIDDPESAATQPLVLVSYCTLARRAVSPQVRNTAADPIVAIEEASAWPGAVAG